jgi:hypothetical protein
MLIDTGSPVYCQEYLDKIKSISLDNKYTKWYINLCRKAALRAATKKEAKELLGYVESHHVLPVSFKLGGEKDNANLVHLTAREHYVVHLLLTRITVGEYQSKMFSAFVIMSGRKVYDSNSRIYEKLLEAARLDKKKRQTGRPCHSAEHKRNLSEKWSGQNNPGFGKPMNSSMLGCTRNTVWVRKDDVRKRVTAKEAVTLVKIGWTLGQGNVFSDESLSHQSKVRSGRTIVYDNPNKTFKRVVPSQVQGYLDMGWELRQTYKFCKHPKT